MCPTDGSAHRMTRQRDHHRQPEICATVGAMVMVATKPRPGRWRRDSAVGTRLPPGVISLRAAAAAPAAMPPLSGHRNDLPLPAAVAANPASSLSLIAATARLPASSDCVAPPGRDEHERQPTGNRPQRHPRPQGQRRPIPSRAAGLRPAPGGHPPGRVGRRAGPATATSRRG
jgi:hypothetical protein